MTNLPRTKEGYLDKISEIKRQSDHNSYDIVAMLGLLVEAIVDLKEATEIPYEPDNHELYTVDNTKF
jgi:hypothetical protein